MWCDTDDRQDVPVIFHFVYFYGNFTFMFVYIHMCVDSTVLYSSCCWVLCWSLFFFVSKTYSFTCHFAFLNFTLVRGVQTFKRGSEPAEVVQALYTDTIWVTCPTVRPWDRPRTH